LSHRYWPNGRTRAEWLDRPPFTWSRNCRWVGEIARRCRIQERERWRSYGVGSCGHCPPAGAEKKLCYYISRLIGAGLDSTGTGGVRCSDARFAVPMATSPVLAARSRTRDCTYTAIKPACHRCSWVSGRTDWRRGLGCSLFNFYGLSALPVSSCIRRAARKVEVPPSCPPR